MKPIRELPALCTEAVVWDDAHNLVFMSVWGRDTLLQQFIAELSLPLTEGGRSSLSFDHEGLSQHVLMPPRDWQAKLSGRAPVSCRIADLVHVWIYDRRAAEQHMLRSTRSFVLSLPQQLCSHTAQVWRALRLQATVPLLDSWCTEVLAEFRQRKWIRALHCAGAITGTEIALPDESEVAELMSDLLRSDPLGRRFPAD